MLACLMLEEMLDALGKATCISVSVQSGCLEVPPIRATSTDTP